MKRRMQAITHRLLSCSLLLLGATTAYSDRPAPERSYTVTSPSGTYTFEMVPSPSQMAATEAHGEARQVLADGSEKTIWSVRGWYAHQTFIADDGHGLVRMGGLADEPFNSRELAVAFYRDGKEIRRYTVGDLIEDEASLRHTVSHYMWQASDGRYPQILSDGRFQLRTVEDRVITFDIATGEILAPGQSAATQAALPEVTREDVDDLFLAMNLLRENDIDLEESKIHRVVRKYVGGTVVWFDVEFANLPVFHNSASYTFDAHRRAARDTESGELLLRGPKLPPARSFPIDHRPDIDASTAIQVWQAAIDDDQFLGPHFEPRHVPEATLGFFDSSRSDVRLVWRVAPDGGDSPEAFVDAKKGDLLFFDSGVRTSGALLPVPAEVDADFSGAWVGAPCGSRKFTRTLILARDGSFQVVDRAQVTYRGTWVPDIRGTGPIGVKLQSEDRDMRQVVLPRDLRFEPDSGMLHEATPGASQLCRYSRSNTPAQATGE